ncbi:MAG: hypothetical protein K1X78_23390 [Verrucomicrobiaceae bacterium]|nr:hypothetical protein [Verrucomicrobiaceae bacterium]
MTRSRGGRETGGGQRDRAGLSIARTSVTAMNRWAITVSVLYVITALILAAPVSIIAWWEIPTVHLKDVQEICGWWQSWLLLGILFVSQYALLRTPVHITRGRPERRGPLWPTVVAGGFMAGLLFIGAVAAVVEGVKPPFESFTAPVIVLLSGVVSWIAWAVVFYRMGKADPARMVSRQSHWLIKGSALELLIAVPMHIIVRHRHECCAGYLTFFGLTTGFAVMLFAFGPAVFFLFVARWRRLHPAAESGGEQVAARP